MKTRYIYGVDITDDISTFIVIDTKHSQDYLEIVDHLTTYDISENDIIKQELVDECVDITFIEEADL